MVTRGHGPRRRARLGAVDGGNIWWVAPSYAISSDIWRDLKRACRGAWTDKSEIERRIELPGGGAVTVKSADNPDSLRGAGLDGLVVDESATIDEEAWKSSLRPALSDKQGWATFFGTPKGFNWFHALFQEAEYLDGWERWQRPSSDNPLLTPKELDTARLEIGSIAYGQEYGAEFTAAGLGMFRREWFGELVESSPAKARRVRAWDKAGTDGAGDYSAGVLLARADGVYYVEDVIRGQWSAMARERIIQQTAELDALKHGRGVEIWLEQEPGSGGKESAELSVKRLAGYAVHAERATGDKAVRAAPFAAQAEAGNVKLVRGAWCRDFLDECDSFPNGQHDDQVDAAALGFNKLALKPGAALYRAS